MSGITLVQVFKVKANNKQIGIATASWSQKALPRESVGNHFRNERQGKHVEF